MVNGRFGQVGIQHAPTDVERVSSDELVNVIAQHQLMEAMNALEIRSKRNHVLRWNVQVCY